MKKTKEELNEKFSNETFKWGYAVLVIIGLIVLGSVIAGFIALSTGVSSIFSKDKHVHESGNVALIKIDGVISTAKDDFSFDKIVGSSDIVKLIEEADENLNVKAILFEINSPGGSAVASSEIADAIKKTNKTTVAWIRDIGTSGAYWVASSTDYIVANRASITGSIGVIASYLEYPGFLERYNVTYRRLVSGKYKDIGSPFKEMTEEEQEIFQKNLDSIGDFFVEEVAKNRNMRKVDVNKIATGVFYIGSEAKNLGLVDELGGKDEAISYIEGKLGITADIAEYKTEKTFFELLSEVASRQSFRIGNGIGSALVSTKPRNSLSITA